MNTSKDKSKKRKRETPIPDTSKPTATFARSKGRSYTTSIALPSSILSAAQTHDLKTSLCGTIARALAVFCVDEIVIFDDGCNSLYHKAQSSAHAAQDARSGYSAFSNPGDFMSHVLSYLETPPYLRRALFEHHPNLKTAGSLPSLDVPSHAKEDEGCEFREGVVVDSAQMKGAESGKVYVNAGLSELVVVDSSQDIPANTRITVQIADSQTAVDGRLHGSAVHPNRPRTEAGYYWGYSTREAGSLMDVFKESPYENGYDFSIGMSERGEPIREFLHKHKAQQTEANGSTEPWQHLLVAFGGPAGLEKAAQNDGWMSSQNLQAREIFDAWINLLPNQGSRTIRTEEAVWIGLMGCSEFVQQRSTHE